MPWCRVIESKMKCCGAIVQRVEIKICVIACDANSIQWKPVQQVGNSHTTAFLMNDNIRSGGMGICCDHRQAHTRKVQYSTRHTHTHKVRHAHAHILTQTCWPSTMFIFQSFCKMLEEEREREAERETEETRHSNTCYIFLCAIRLYRVNIDSQTDFRRQFV